MNSWRTHGDYVKSAHATWVVEKRGVPKAVSMDWLKGNLQETIDKQYIISMY
jgi:hypothetical protein